MLVFVTVRALGELDLKLSCCSPRNMALRALDFSVRAIQGIAARCVVLHRESRRRPSVNRMAGFALVAVFALGELTVMWIRFVTIRAKLVWYRRLEIPAAVTGGAIHRAMLAAQRKVGFIMIKLRAYSGR